MYTLCDFASCFILNENILQPDGSNFSLFHMNNLQVVEQGSHDELLALRGYYYSLVTADPTMTEGKHILLSVITRYLCFHVLNLILFTNNFNSPSKPCLTQACPHPQILCIAVTYGIYSNAKQGFFPLNFVLKYVRSS